MTKQQIKAHLDNLTAEELQALATAAEVKVGKLRQVTVQNLIKHMSTGKMRLKVYVEFKHQHQEGATSKRFYVREYRSYGGDSIMANSIGAPEEPKDESDTVAYVPAASAPEFMPPPFTPMDPENPNTPPAEPIV